MPLKHSVILSSDVLVAQTEADELSCTGVLWTGVMFNYSSVLPPSGEERESNSSRLHLQTEEFSFSGFSGTIWTWITENKYPRSHVNVLYTNLFMTDNARQLAREDLTFLWSIQFLFSDLSSRCLDLWPRDRRVLLSLSGATLGEI